MKFQITTIQKGLSHFGWCAHGYETLAEAEMAKNEHANLQSPAASNVKGYVIMGSDASIHYYDASGAYVTKHELLQGWSK
jgi:hypothetical protein